MTKRIAPTSTADAKKGEAQVQRLHSALPGVYACRVTSDRAFGKHWHHSYGFGVMEVGGHRSASGRGTVDALAGSVLTHNPGEVHDGIPLQGRCRQWVMLQVDVDTLHSLGGRIDNSVGVDAEFTHPVLQDPFFVAHLQHMLREWSRRGDFGHEDGLIRLADESALTVLCTRLLRQHSTARVALPAPASMVAVREWLADESLAPPSLHTMASSLGISRYQLLRRFTEVYGITPHAWLRAHRLEHARALIAQGQPLASAASGSGFSDQSHMTRTFRDHLGYSPGASRPVLQPRSRRKP